MVFKRKRGGKLIARPDLARLAGALCNLLKTLLERRQKLNRKKIEILTQKCLSCHLFREVAIGVLKEFRCPKNGSENGLKKTSNLGAKKQ